MPIPEEMMLLRNLIDTVDDKLIALLAERFRIASLVADCKHRAEIPARLACRIERVIKRAEANGVQAGLPSGVACQLWTVLVEETCRFEEGLHVPGTDASRRPLQKLEIQTGG